ncbi:vegetatible incompatibility het-E-1 [Fusarium beomiforme]|uniref:Vegetatible incompatibility het-E-1 n=1 Tax=Fusarium beomiforme TaxID=44412 RepID=A0A9P5AVN4_9HYPO|nr:vegetatible incompatibility het-E-1 [Fusarium beomiforme]
MDRKRFWNDEQTAKSSTDSRKKIHSGPPSTLTHGSYTIAWICALWIEMTAARAMLDDVHGGLQRHINDTNSYVLGSIGRHNVVIACLPNDQYGTNNAAIVFTNLMRTFPSIQLGLMVGIGGGAPNKADIRLGDIVVGSRVMQHDMGKALADGQIHRTSPASPSQVSSILRDKSEKLPGYERPTSADRLFLATYRHESSTSDCATCDQSKLVQRGLRASNSPVIHYGAIASGNQVIKDSVTRDKLSHELDVICFEMEAAGLMDVCPCLPVRGICDYSDSHKTKEWQRYAAATAAAYAREFLGELAVCDGLQNLEYKPDPAFRQKLNSLVITSQSIESALDRQRRQKQKLYEDENNKACLQALYTGNPVHDKSRIEETKGGLLSNCYSWIFHTEEFQAWHQDTDRRLLWIKGDPGKGKTMLLCGIIDRLDALTPNVVSYFFCQATENHQNTAIAVLRGLIWSLACQHPSLISHVRNQFDIAGEKAFMGPNTWHLLSGIFRGMMVDSNNRVPEGTLIVIDALDECTHEKERLLNLIIEHCTDENAQVRWIVSSRNWVEFENAFMRDSLASRRVVLSLEHSQETEDCIEEAVQQFVQFKVNELIKHKPLKSSSIIAQVRNLFNEKSGNTFLWVALVFEKLMDSKIEAWQVPEKLKEFPSGLQDLYKRMMQEVEESGHRSRCKDILAVTALVHRPISLAELSSSARSLSQFSDDLESLKRLVLRCGCFLVVPDDIVYFMHQSAKDYLLENEFAKECVWEAKHEDLPSREITRSHRAVLLTILKTLRDTLKHDIYDLKEPGASIRDFEVKGATGPLVPFGYACCYWTDHLLSFDDQIAHDILGFLKGTSLYWLEACALLGKVPVAVLAIQKLQKLALGTSYHEVTHFLRDVNRFILYFKSAIEEFPLQIYTSGLIFSPRKSLARQAFAKHTLTTLKRSFAIQDDWDACIQTLEGHNSNVYCLAFSRDSQLLASGSLDHTVRIWDVATGNCVQTLDRHSESVWAVAFSTDNRCFASASKDHTIRLWNIENGKFTEGHIVNTTEDVSGLVFSPDGRWLASWLHKSDVDIRDAKTGNFVYSIPVPEQRGVLRLVFSSDGQKALLGSDKLGIWDVAKRSWIRRFVIRQKRLLAAAFSPEERWVGHSHGENGHSIWDISESSFSQRKNILKDDTDPPSLRYKWGLERPSAISGDCRQVATCTTTPVQLAIFDVTNGAIIAEHQIQRGSSDELPRSMAWSADNEWLAVGGVSGHINMWDPSAIGNRGKTNVSTTNVHAIAITSDGQKLAWGLEDGTVKIVDVADPDIILHTLEGHDSHVCAALFSTNGKMLATQCESCVKIWNMETTGECFRTFKAGQLRFDFPNNIGRWAMAFSADDSKFAFSRGKYGVEIHDLTTQSMYQVDTGEALDTSLAIWSLAFSPDGFSLVVWEKGFCIHIWDLQSRGAQNREFESYGITLATALSADGNLLALSTFQGQIYVFQMPTGTCIFELNIGWRIRQLSFSSDGRSFMTEYGHLIPEYWPTNIDKGKHPMSVPYAIQGYGIGFNGAWLTKHGERFLWLPPEYRPNLKVWKTVLVADSVITIRDSSNRLSMYHFMDI